MPILIGQAIDHHNIEAITSAWTGDHFARMCYDLIWAVSNQAACSLPDFNVRENTKDQGIDAEWRVELPSTQVTSPLVSPGLNVFQVKKRDRMARDQKAIVSSLENDLKGALLSVSEKTKKHPDRYTLFVNLELIPSEKQRIKKSIRSGYSKRCQIEIVDAGILQALLNDLTHLRTAYFTTLRLRTWFQAQSDLRLLKLHGFKEAISFTGRKKELAQFESYINDSSIRVIVISGLHDAGKTRFTLEGTRQRSQDVVQAMEPEMRPADYRALTAARREVICIVEDPEDEFARVLIAEALTLPNLKFVINIPSRFTIDPLFGNDPRVRYLNLTGLSEVESHELIKATGIQLPLDFEARVLRKSGGLPGVILAAVLLEKDLIGNLEDFEESIAREYIRRIERIVGAEALDYLRLFSLLTHVNVAGNASELSLMCRIFGEGRTENRALLTLDKLEELGVITRSSTSVRVTFPILATHLASELLKRQSDKLFLLFAKLDESGRYRLIKRLNELHELHSQEVQIFFENLFVMQGLFQSQEEILENIGLLALVADSTPGRTMEKIASLCHSMSFGSASERNVRQIVQILEKLAFHSKTSANAIITLWGLVKQLEGSPVLEEAESLLREFFHPLQPQVTLSLNERLDLFRALISESLNRNQKLLLASIVSAAVPHVGGFFFLRETVSTVPHPRPLTYEKVDAYIQELIGWLQKMADLEPDLETASALRSTLAETAAHLSYLLPEKALQIFDKIATKVETDTDGIELNDILEPMGDALHALNWQIRNEKQSAMEVQRLTQFVNELNQIMERLEKGGSFATRLMLWTKARIRSWVEPEERFQILKRLAREAVLQPLLLTEELISKLLPTYSLWQSRFFKYLGQLDMDKLFTAKVEAVGAQLNGTQLFADYWSGVAEREKQASKTEVQVLLEKRKIDSRAAIQAALRLDSRWASELIVSELKSGHLEVSYLAELEPWVGTFSAGELDSVLTEALKVDESKAYVVVLLLAWWIRMDKELTTELESLGWRALMFDPPILRKGHESDFDELASQLAISNPDLGIELFKIIVGRSVWEDRWNPFMPNHQFCSTLQRSRRAVFFQILTDVTLTNVGSRFHIDNAVTPNSDEDSKTLLALAKTSRATARIVALWTTRAHGELFWNLFDELIQLYPDDDVLFGYLVGGIKGYGTVISVPESEFHEARRREVEKRLGDPNLPPVVRLRLREALERLREEVDRNIVWEYDLGLDDLRKFIEDKNSSHRIWAIGRFLKYAKWEDIMRNLTTEDIKEVLPIVDLPDKKRRMLESALEVWERGV
ncbi:hypothetical protein L0156_10715 [bacterium]|nr:hypothetical protein [bacterium]